VAGGIDNDREVWHTERGGDWRWCGGARAGGLGKGGSTRVAAHTVGAREEEKERVEKTCCAVVLWERIRRIEKKKRENEIEKSIMKKYPFYN
jgi:hypothetical protein